MNKCKLIVLSTLLAVTTISPLRADSITDIVGLTSPWLFIATGSSNDGKTPEGKSSKGVGDALDISNFEIGAIKAPVPANEFGGDYGPDLSTGDNIPEIPGYSTNDPDGSGGAAFGADLADGQVITNSGQVAITFTDKKKSNKDRNGRFSVSNVGVFATNNSDGGPIPNDLPAGIVTAGPASTNTSNGGSIQNNSNSSFNDSDYPNPIGDPDTTSAPGSVPPRLASGNGITGDHDFSSLRTALDDALDLIPTLVGVNPLSAKMEIDDNDTLIDVLDGNTLDLTAWGAEIKGDDLDKPSTLYVKADHGLNVIDFDLDGNDLKLTNGNIVIDGFEDSFIIFRIPDDSKFNISQGTIHVADTGTGIDLGSVVFFSARTETSSVFSFDNTIFNGVAFWTLGDGSGSHVNNSQGCVQYVGDKLNFQNIRYNSCHGAMYASAPAGVPAPSAFVSGLAGLIAMGVCLQVRARRSA